MITDNDPLPQSEHQEPVKPEPPPDLSGVNATDVPVVLCLLENIFAS